MMVVNLNDSVLLGNGFRLTHFLSENEYNEFGNIDLPVADLVSIYYKIYI